MQKLESSGKGKRPYRLAAREHARKTRAVFLLANARLAADSLWDFALQFETALGEAVGWDEYVKPAAFQDLKQTSVSKFRVAATIAGETPAAYKARALAAFAVDSPETARGFHYYLDRQAWARRILDELAADRTPAVAREIQDVIEGIRWASPRTFPREHGVSFRLIPAFEEDRANLLAWIIAREILEPDLVVRKCPECARFFPQLTKKRRMFCGDRCRIVANNRNKIQSGYLRTFMARKRGAGNPAYF